MQEKRTNCYKCQYRGTILGNAYSKCQHPEARRRPGLLAIGIKDGGRAWPVKYNPVFLTACLGFKPKEEEPCLR